MRVTVIAQTRFEADLAKMISGGIWEPEDTYDDASALTEFGGRFCYQSWNRPNPATATNAGYLANIIDHTHFSVMEHGTVTMVIEDVSRSLTHELVRHRHTSPSQLSHRFVTVKDSDPDGKVPYVVPPLFESEMGLGKLAFPSDTEAILESVWKLAIKSYDQLVAIWLPRLIRGGVDPHTARKRAREAARAVLPHMTPTGIVLTGNHRAWRELLAKRGTVEADAEIRRLALLLYYQLVEREPNLYQDFSVGVGPNGETILVQA